jgi:ligand-binding sensor domain-containing protein
MKNTRRLGVALLLLTPYVTLWSWLTAAAPCLGLGLGLGQEAVANPPLELQGRGQWRTYGVTDGLAALDVHDILRDRDGNMWFATEGGGVSRYDGDYWTTFNIQDGLLDNSVYSIVQGSDGDLWFGSRLGVSRYDGSTYTTFTERDGLVVSSVFTQRLVADRDGAVWTYARDLGGTNRYDGDTWTFDEFAGLARFSEPVAGRDGSMWFATKNGAVRYQDGGWRTYTRRDGLSPAPTCGPLPRTAPEPCGSEPRRD